MKTHLDCIPCFFRQALAAARHVGADEKGQKQVLDKIASIIPSFPLTLTPPEMAKKIYHLVAETLRVDGDLYKNIKKRSNEYALSLYDQLEQKIKKSKNRLLTAVELAIAGNIIDYAANTSLNLDEEIKNILQIEGETIKKDQKFIFHYDDFKNVLANSKNILYLADNAGEIVFDKLLIREMKKTNKHIKITYAVKEKPIINDALIEDAYQCGLDKVAKVISSGSDASGTVLSICSQEFLNVFNDADMIISKGQGNFEALSDAEKPIFFLFKVKCQIIATTVNGKIGNAILFYKK